MSSLDRNVPFDGEQKTVVGLAAEDFSTVWSADGGSCSVAANTSDTLAPDRNQTADQLASNADAAKIQQQVAGLADGTANSVLLRKLYRNLLLLRFAVGRESGACRVSDQTQRGEVRMISKRVPSRMGFVFAALWLCIQLAVGQVRSGTIVGKVVDPSGAAVPDVLVMITAQDTNWRHETRTNALGEYVAPYLQLGRYTVRVEQTGFRRATVSEVAVATAGITRVDLQLEVATVETTMEVRAFAAELQSESASVQNAIAAETIEAVPNITSNPFYFTILQPGVVPRAGLNETQSVNSFGVGIDGRRWFSAFAINGGQAFTNDIVVDGVSVQGSAWNEAAVVPNTEGIQEVRTLINNFSAEYGRAQGVVTITTKTGSNELHGSVFDRIRNEAFNANTFGNNARGIRRPRFKVNSYGGTLGGPIRKDKAFFFVSYEGLRHSESVDYLKTVPTDLEKQGNFSQTLVPVNGVPTPIKIYDPFDVQQVETNVYQRKLIPDSIIPTPDPYALKLLSFYPSPNRAPEDVYNRNNYYLRGSRQFSKNSVNSRLDYHLAKHSIYGTAGTTTGQIETPPSWGSGNPFFGRNEFIGRFLSDSNPYGSIGDTVVLSPTLILDLRYGINRIRSNNEAEVISGFNYSQFGIPSDIQAINAVPGAAPEFCPGGNLSCLNQTNSLHKRERQTNHDLVGSMTKIVRNWTLKLGGEYRAYLSNYTDAEESVWIQTDGGYTRELVNATGGAVLSVTADRAGWAPASILLGAGNLRIAPGRGALPAFAQKYLALYSQNDWRATSKLTVNLGLRWDLQPGPTDRFNRISSFDFGAKNPFGTRGALAFAGTRGYSRNLWDTHYRDFGPRVGLAYRLTDSIVLRAGYGITYLPTNTGYFDGPFTYGMDSFADSTSTDAFGPNPAGVLVGRYYQVNRVVRGIGADPTYPQLYGGSVGTRFDRRDYLDGMVQQWNLYVEKRLASWLVSAGYTASKGAHLPFARMPANDIQLQPQSLLDSWRTAYIARNGMSHPGVEQVPSPLQPATGPLVPFNGYLGRATISRTESLFPYPHFGYMEVQRSIGYSNYNAMILKVSRRLDRQGPQLNAHYTWSKASDLTQTEAYTNGFGDSIWYLGVDRRNYRNSYRLSATDVPHRFVASYVYELPFGSGKRFGIQNTVLRTVAGGWRTAGVATFQSGSPFMIVGAANGALNGLPDRVPGVPVEVPKELQRWYDGKTTVTLPGGRQIRPCGLCFLKYSVEAFRGRLVTTPDGSVVNDIFWYGTSALNYSDMRMDGLNNWNMSLERTFRVRERMSLDFSARFTNAFNHTQFKPQWEYNVDLGNTSRTANGQGDNASFGTRGTNTLDPRQLEFRLLIRF